MSCNSATRAVEGLIPSEDLRIADELFVLPDGDNYLLYAPVTMGVARVSPSAARLLQDVKTGKNDIGEFDADALVALVDAGIVVRRQEADWRMVFPEKNDYDPAGITLFLTTKCTLACTYCYARGHERGTMMSWETARMGIDWLFRHAESRGKRDVTVTFHGGGEVTVARTLLQQCVLYARAEGAARGIVVRTGAGLNGVMKGPLLDWVIRNIDGATVSMDGLPEVQNAQRPLVSGRGSFDVVAAALHRMDEAGFNYAIRTTVSRLALPSMVESVEFMCQQFGARMIHIEPASAPWGARTDDTASPDPNEFVRQFRAARAVARAYGRKLRYSGARFGTPTNRFCQVSDDLLAVTPDGLASACYEIGGLDDGRAETFIYGRFNRETGSLDIDMEKIRRLRTLTVEHKPWCNGCFCRWSCAGECSAKLAVTDDPWDAAGNPRCIINRELTLDLMREYLEYGGGFEPDTWP